MKTRAVLLAALLGFPSLPACSSDGTTSSEASTATSSGSSSSSSSSTSGGGGSGGAGGGTGGADGGMTAFALTSTGFTEGAAIPAKYACAGANVSPDLTWTMGPAGTQSYAFVFTDKSNNLIHWVIWDIPSSTLSLPEGVSKVANPPVPAGAKQVKSYDNKTFGYLGPCPPSVHTYQFAVFALDVATLPNVTTNSTRQAVEAEILAHDLASATLSGTYTP